MIERVSNIEIKSTHLHQSRVFGQFSGVIHGITRKVVGAGLADGNVGYSVPRDRSDAWRMRQQWLASAGLDADRIVVAHQVHGNQVVAVELTDAGKGAKPDLPTVGKADGLMTDNVGVVLMTLHADCMPILFYDPKRHVVATAHAGWRGTAADVAGEVVASMTSCYGSNPGDLHCYLGPAIGSECYEVGEDVVEAWTTAFSDPTAALTKRGSRWQFDLEIANRLLLERAGVKADHVESSGICTRCHGDEWFSHRGQGGLTGRYASFVALA